MDSQPVLRTALAATAAVMFAVPLLVILFLLGDDEKPCPPAGSPTVAPTAPGGAQLPPGITKVWPIRSGEYTISDVFGSRGGGHRGVDMAAPEGTAIYAAAAGVVADAGPASGFGQWIVLDHNINGSVVSTVYGHMYPSGILVHTGDPVSAGQQIAMVGSNGESTGAHLHLEVVPGGRLAGGAQVDPIPWLADAAQPGASTPAVPAPTVPPDPADQAAAVNPGNPTTTGTAPTTGQGPATAPADPNCTPKSGTYGGGTGDNLGEATEVPPDLAPWYQKAGTLCPQISASLLAAQGKAETGFQRGLTSPANAQGLGQFLPGTAAAPSPVDGQPYVIDADGNGTASVWDDGDAIIGQGRYMCALAVKIDGWIAEGKVRDSGDRRELYIAAYNAGEGAVLNSGGFPTGHPDYANQTRPYVDKILAWEPGFARKLT
ncbi:M23 family metallopeptidase [Nocardia brasiliensis]|uniref:M23 family metallopeptidase n=1 Tax=Nocardia brasiliensis TaxID=37326 RepID=UPI002456B1C3|nr:M23 family metallopeptidase [Nocardia brasiliensis]